MDHYLIEHCAPTLASIKTANLFRVSFDTQKNLFDAVRRWNNTLRDKGVLCFCLCLHEHTALIYVVRMSRLQNDLSDPAVGEFLSSFGYKPKRNRRSPHSQTTFDAVWYVSS